MRPNRIIVILVAVLALGACSSSSKSAKADFTGMQAKMNAATQDINDPVLRSLPEDGAMGLGEMMCGDLANGTAPGEVVTKVDFAYPAGHLRPATLQAILQAAVKYLCPEQAGRVG